MQLWHFHYGILMQQLICVGDAAAILGIALHERQQYSGCCYHILRNKLTEYLESFSIREMLHAIS